MMVITAYLGLGSNVGDREKMLGQAMGHLDQDELIEVVDVSSFVESKAQGVTFQQPDFLNAACSITTMYSPMELLTRTEHIERLMGRKTKGDLTPRLIDIDILLYNDEVICDQGLTIPHPLLHERLFVLTPLLELAPTMIHPVLNVSISDLMQECSGELL